jgi:DNA-binding MarR family transcriptional regulator
MNRRPPTERARPSQPARPRRASARPRAEDDEAISEAIGNLFARTRRLFWAEAFRHLEEGGESPHSYRLLEHVMRAGPAAQCDVAAALAQHPAYVSRTLDELEAEGLVRRRRDATDRRKVVVEATARGRARCESSCGIVARARERFLEPLSVAERRVLRTLLGKLALVAEQDETVARAATAASRARAAARGRPSRSSG